MARLGRRAGDLAQLRLTDIEWDNGTLRVMGKGRFEVRLPLPQDVGDALLRYLECRPQVDHTDRVFLRNIAPFKPFVTPHCISCVVKRAMRRASVKSPAKGAHLLRHTAATEMLRHGVPLDQIGLVLRHRSIDMTAYYAKVGVVLLEQVAQPLAGGELMTRAVKSYLAARHAAGFELKNAYYLLHSFARFAAARRETHIRTATAIDWASRSVSVAQRDTRLKAVCRFARYMWAEDSRHETPPARHFGYHKRRPYPISKPDSKVEVLVAQLGAEQWSEGATSGPSGKSGVNDTMDDASGPSWTPNNGQWLKLRIDGKEGWIHTEEDFDALGLSLEL